MAEEGARAPTAVGNVGVLIMAIVNIAIGASVSKILIKLFILYPFENNPLVRLLIETLR